MKRYFIIILLLSSVGLSAQKGKIPFYNLDSQSIEQLYPCWYALDFNNKCSLDSIDLIHRQTASMDSLIMIIVDSLATYYKYNNELDLMEKIKNSFLAWKELREHLDELYFHNFIVGTSRGYFESAYRRDLSKQFLISLVPIISSLP